jgi:hypothetical protein
MQLTDDLAQLIWPVSALGSVSVYVACAGAGAGAKEAMNVEEEAACA